MIFVYCRPINEMLVDFQGPAVVGTSFTRSKSYTIKQHISQSLTTRRLAAVKEQHQQQHKSSSQTGKPVITTPIVVPTQLSTSTSSPKGKQKSKVLASINLHHTT